MQKTENNGNGHVYDSFRKIFPEQEFNYDQFNRSASLMGFYQQVLDLSDYCPIKLNYDLTEAFALLQEKNTSENYIRTLATFNRMLIFLHLNHDFIESEFNKMNELYNAYKMINDGK